MTVLQLMKSTLRKLDRPTDNDTVTLYQERLMGFLNEALLDLTAELRPWRRDTVTLANGQAELSSLPCTCLKVIAARIDGKRRLFYYGSTRGTLLFPGAALLGTPSFGASLSTSMSVLVSELGAN